MTVFAFLFCLSIFLIALVMVLIKLLFFRWKEEHKIESRTEKYCVERPTVALIIYNDKCVIRRRQYENEIFIYDVISKSELSLPKSQEQIETISRIPSATHDSTMSQTYPQLDKGHPNGSTPVA